MRKDKDIVEIVWEINIYNKYQKYLVSCNKAESLSVKRLLYGQL